ncbi:unnamed protein product [Larinioides sclopetarius]|uniref:G-protein coupled receptors family 1 profile domain-containing protein n=1 Tax=Larinioides sclopetarius TaxID=280406 RepID=A0AAV2BIB4_9ARAC
MILIVVGNMLVCIAIATEKALKTVQNWFIASLAVSDFLVGLIIMPFSLAKEVMGYWIFGRIWCEIHSALDVFLCTASINSLCLISLDRYWSVTHAVEYLRKRTPRRSLAMICGVWVLSAIISLPPLVGWKKPEKPSNYPECLLSDDVGYVLYSAFGSFYVPAFVMVFVYCRIFVAARSRARRHLKKKQKAASVATELTNDPIKDKSTTTTTCTSFSNASPPDRSKDFEAFSPVPGLPKIPGLIMASFILAWLPFFVLYVLEALCKVCDIGPTGFAVAFWLGYCNSALNPIIYTIFNRDFRKAFRKILFK